MSGRSFRSDASTRSMSMTCSSIIRTLHSKFRLFRYVPTKPTHGGKIVSRVPCVTFEATLSIVYPSDIFVAVAVQCDLVGEQSRHEVTLFWRIYFRVMFPVGANSYIDSWQVRAGQR